MSITRGVSRIRQKLHVLGKRNAPPKTYRYCPVCQNRREFVYNRIIGHSECEFCGGRKIPTILPKLESGFSLKVSIIPDKKETKRESKKRKRIKWMNCPGCRKPIPSNAKHHTPCGWWITGIPRDPPGKV